MTNPPYSSGGGGGGGHALPQSLPPEAMATGVSSTFLADQLQQIEEAQSALERQRARREASSNESNNDHNEEAAPTTAMQSSPSSSLASIPPSKRVPVIVRQVSVLTLASEYAAYLRHHSPATQDAPNLENEVLSLTSLAVLLLRHTPAAPPRRSKRSRHDPTANPPYTRILLEGYRPLHRRIRSKLILDLRRSIRSCSASTSGSTGGGAGYPSPSACRTLRASLEQSIAPEWEGGGIVDEFAHVVTLLVRVQLYHDALMGHLQGGFHDDQSEEGGAQQQQQVVSRLDVIDELIRPLVKRAEFHFVDEGGNEASSSASAVRMTSANLNELPRWLFRYVRNALTGEVEEAEKGGGTGTTGNDDCGMIGVILDGLMPVLNVEVESFQLALQQQLQMEVGGESDVLQEQHNQRNTTPSSSLLRYHPFASPLCTEVVLSYLLSEVSSLAMHVLRRRDYVCNLSSRKPVEAAAKALIDGVDQCLRFDSFAQDVLNSETGRIGPYDGGAGSMMRGRGGTTARLVADNPPLLDLWIDVDRRSGLDALRAASILGPSASSSVAPPSPLAETYATLIASILTKSSVALSASHSLKRRYVAGTAVPVTAFFMDGMHEAASVLRDGMLRAAGRRAVDLDVHAMQINLQRWLEIICGMDLAVTALESSASPSTVVQGILSPPPTTPGARGVLRAQQAAATPFTPGSPQTPATHNTFTTTPGQDQDLLRLSQSMRRLRDAMVDEYSSTLVETIIMERVGLAGYFMTAPHRLMGDSNVILTTGADEGKAADDMPPSKELERPVSVLLSILDSLCLAHSSSGKIMIDSTIESQPPMMDAVVVAIMNNVSNRIEDKFEEVATDAHGTIPEIQRSGALQFLSDVQLFHAMFDSVAAVINDVPDEDYSGTNAQPEGVFGSLVLLARLMAADNKQVRSLRDGLFGLVMDSMPHLSPGMSHIPFQPFDSDGTLYETAKSMLESKGYSGVEVEDAVSVLNRRKVTTSAVEALERL